MFKNIRALTQLNMLVLVVHDDDDFKQNKRDNKSTKCFLHEWVQPFYSHLTVVSQLFEFQFCFVVVLCKLVELYCDVCV